MDYVDELFTDTRGRVVNIKFAYVRPGTTAEQLIEQVRSADRQIAAGTATRVLDADLYVQPI